MMKIIKQVRCCLFISIAQLMLQSHLSAAATLMEKIKHTAATPDGKRSLTQLSIVLIFYTYLAIHERNPYKYIEWIYTPKKHSNFEACNKNWFIYFRQPNLKLYERLKGSFAIALCMMHFAALVMSENKISDIKKNG
jgi:hypothetical protein